MGDINNAHTQVVGKFLKLDHLGGQDVEVLTRLKWIFKAISSENTEWSNLAQDRVHWSPFNHRNEWLYSIKGWAIFDHLDY
jgi:hypothetical protein